MLIIYTDLHKFQKCFISLHSKGTGIEIAVR